MDVTLVYKYSVDKVKITKSSYGLAYKVWICVAGLAYKVWICVAGAGI